MRFPMVGVSLLFASACSTAPPPEWVDADGKPVKETIIRDPFTAGLALLKNGDGTLWRLNVMDGTVSSLNSEYNFLGQAGKFAAFYTTTNCSGDDYLWLPDLREGEPSAFWNAERAAFEVVSRKGTVAFRKKPVLIDTKVLSMRDEVDGCLPISEENAVRRVASLNEASVAPAPALTYRFPLRPAK